MAYKASFMREVKELYPEWVMLHEALNKGSVMVGRYLDDASNERITCEEILCADSLKDLQDKARIIKRKEKLYRDYISGACYETEEERRREAGCPRLYAQNSGDIKALDAFTCLNVFYIPQCPKFDTGECWKRFDELGLQIK